MHRFQAIAGGQAEASGGVSGTRTTRILFSDLADLVAAPSNRIASAVSAGEAS
jgi:hypothetical protein